MPDKGGKKAGRKDSGTSKASSQERKVGGKQQAAKGAPSDTRSEASDQDSDIHAIDYVPVVKEADIGRRFVTLLCGRIVLKCVKKF